MNNRRFITLLTLGLMMFVRAADVAIAASDPMPFMAYGANASSKELVAVRFDTSGAKIVQRLPMGLAGGTTP